MNRLREPRAVRPTFSLVLVLAIALGAFPPLSETSAQNAALPLPAVPDVTAYTVERVSVAPSTTAPDAPLIDDSALAASGAIWTVETIDSAGNPGQHSSLALDTAGHLHVGYYDQGSTSLRYAYFDGASWVTETVDSTADVGQYASLSLDASNRPHVSYYDADNMALKYAYWNGSSWIVTTVDNTGDVGQYTSLAVDANGVPHISYYDATIAGSLKYAYLDGATWISTTVDGVAGVGEHTSLALENDLYPRISYHHSLEKQLKYAYLSGSTWTKTAVNGPGEGGAYTSLTLDANGYPHISYLDDWVENDLKYAYFDGVAWISTTVHTGGAGFATQPSLALDASDRPHIAYYDNILYALRYAYHDGSSWHVETIDSTAFLEAYPSLVLDAAGYPHISYYHQVDGLKHAWLQPCAAPQVLDVNGPNTVISGTWNTFTATVFPPTATLPITFTWEFPGWAPLQDVQHGTESNLEIGSTMTGTYAITVTAQNCGGSASTAREVFVDDLELPDLVATYVWDEGDAIWYQITNRGSLTVTASYTIGLSIDGGGASEHAVDAALGPNQATIGTFPYPYSCSGVDDTAQVTVDTGGTVVERDEANNTFQRSWLCDRQGPVFTWGPTVTLITADSATIEWNTDEHSDSAIQYGATAGGYDGFEHDPADVTVHSITLNGLSPSTVYHYQARSTDPNGYQSFSDEFLFETLPASSTPPSTPQVIVEPVSGRPDLFEIRAVYSATTDIDRVAFFIGGKHVGTDYADDDGQYATLMSPYGMGFSRDDFYGSTHSVEARAYTWGGSLYVNPYLFGPTHETPPAEVEITFPPPNYTIFIEGDTAPAGTQVSIIARAVEYEWECEWIDTGSRVKKPSCADVEKPVDTVQFLVDNQVVHTSSGSITHIYTLDLSGSSPSLRTVRVRAIASDGTKHETQTTIYIYKTVHEPILDVTRDVTRIGNYFHVQLTLENKAEASDYARIDRIQDNITAFQAIDKSEANYDVTSSYDWNWAWVSGYTSKVDWVNIDVFSGSTDYVTLLPGEQLVVTYDIVPVLYENQPYFGIGERNVKVYYEDSSARPELKGFSRRVTFLQADVGSALHSADYLIVTHPKHLLGRFSRDDVNVLLSSMAHLAKLKQGALGFLEGQDTHARDVLDALVEPGGGWATRLHPSFSTPGDGYLLIVGESEIVPGWHEEGFDVPWKPEERIVDYSDQRYANAGGVPHLIVGRAIGNDPQELASSLQASINVHEGTAGYEFDRSHAFLLAGQGLAQGGFTEDIEALADTLTSDGVGVTEVYGIDHQVVQEFYHVYDQNDGFAAGDVDGDGRDEIVIADQDDPFYILDGNGTQVGAFTRTGVADSFEAGDRLAVGDVGWGNQAEIIVGDHSNGYIYVYDENGVQRYRFDVGFSIADGLAVGDVNDDGKDEIVVAKWQSDRIYIYDRVGTLLGDFARTYDQFDGLAVGDVFSNTVDPGQEEIIIGDVSGDRIDLYSAGGSLLDTIDRDLEPGFSLATGNFFPKGRQELIVGLPPIKEIFIFGWNHTEGKVTAYNYLYQRQFMDYDGLATADVMGDARAEIVIGSRLDWVRIIDQDYCSRIDQTVAQPGTLVGKDVLFYSGHGNPIEWGCGLNIWDLPTNFGGTTPVALAPSCLTGNYEDRNDASIAESLLNSGAAAYIGATQVSRIADNIGFGNEIFEKWGATESLGQAFFEFESERWGLGGDWNQLWVYEYNLYGDPKFGATSSLTSLSVDEASLSAQSSPTALVVEVPDYTITPREGYDLVEIPGGHMLLEEGVYQVPYWSLSVDYAAGQQVQDVVLAERSGMVTDTNLTIPVPTMAHNGPASVALLPAPSEDGSWFPDLELQYEWSTHQNPDGTSTLLVKVYPLYYYAQTGDVRFYKNYTFTVETITSTVVVDWLTTDENAYAQGEQVQIDLWVENTGAVQDVIVEATIRRGAGGEFVDGLPLRNLHDLVGEASLALEWDSSGFEAGDYYVEVALRDTEGNLLDSETQSFRLGIVLGEVAALSATPALFQAGDVVDIAMTFTNTGTVPLTGTAVIQVQTADGVTVVDTFTHTVANLAPGNTIILNDAWNTTGATEEDYRIVGYVLYDSTATSPEIVTVSTRMRVYLPLVIRSHQ